MNKVKKVPMRQCIACRTQRPKRELLRIVRDSEGVLFYDSKGKVSGRGAYLCVSANCLDKAVKNKLFPRQLNAELDSDLLAQLKGLVGDDNSQD